MLQHIIMKTVLHKAQDRGVADHGWLQSNHSFSFAGYMDPSKMRFGLLRVLNDDQVAPGQGFGTHPHDNMEIISIPLKGALEHRDNMGNTTIIKTNDVQIMSAGTGVAHSEYNHSQSEWVNFLQLWIFPQHRNIDPNYDQKTFDPQDRQNQWQTLVSPNNENADGVRINQQAYIKRVNLSTGEQLEYTLQQEQNGVYFLLLEGETKIGEELVMSRDALGVWDATSVSITAAQDSDLLAIEVPMD